MNQVFFTTQSHFEPKIIFYGQIACACAGKRLMHCARCLVKLAAKRAWKKEKHDVFPTQIGFGDDDVIQESWTFTSQKVLIINKVFLGRQWRDKTGNTHNPQNNKKNKLSWNCGIIHFKK